MASGEAVQDMDSAPILLSARPLRTRLGPRGGIVTREAVFEAAEELDAQLGRATLQGIRAKLGGGSLTPIAEHFRAYRAAKLKAASASPEELLTASLREAFVVAIGNAQTEARKACAAELEEGEAQRQELVEAMVEVEAERERLQDQVDELQVTVMELREEAAQRQAEHRERDRERDGTTAALTQDRNAAREAARELQVQLATSEAARAQAEAAAKAHKADLRSMTEAFQAERHGHAEADKARAVAEARAEARAEAARGSERELERTKQLAEEVRASLDKLRDVQREEARAAQALALEHATLQANLLAERERVAELHSQRREALAAQGPQRAITDAISRKAKEARQ